MASPRTALARARGEAEAQLIAARSLLDENLVWDNHVCLALDPERISFAELLEYRHAGVDVVSVNIGFGPMVWAEQLAIITSMRRWIARCEAMQLAASLDDIVAARASGKLAVVFDSEGLDPFAGALDRLETAHALGVRWILIAYNRANFAGGGCLDASDPGLSVEGRRVIDEMERLGIIPCVSHTGVRTAAEAIDHAQGPVILSHSHPRSLVDHPRNVPDDLACACATKGGVIGLTGAGPFLGGDDALVDRLADHIIYLVELVGASHVGLSLDYVFDRANADALLRRHPASISPGTVKPGGFRSLRPSAYPEIVAALLRRGVQDADIVAIAGGNWARVARATWR